jgi:GNAT superfamily N-acetyltransferase
VVDDVGSLPQGIELRATTSEDRGLLLALYGSTRVDELSVVSWGDAEKTAFVTMQFEAQDASYRQSYPDGQFLIVVVEGEPIGRLYLARLEEEVRLVDLTLLPAQRGRGIGSALMAWLVAQTDHDGLPLTLHVEPWNPARRLYDRLGFQSLEQRGIYEFMRREPRDQLKTAS